MRSHVAQNNNSRRSAIDEGAIATERKARKRTKEGFGWTKTVAGQFNGRFKGRGRVGWTFASRQPPKPFQLPWLLEMPAQASEASGGFRSKFAFV